jgi:hypothetical protein
MPTRIFSKLEKYGSTDRMVERNPEPAVFGEN